jgi:hypothetical protein
MSNGTVVLAGNLPIEHLALDLLVEEFGWSLRECSNLRGVAELNTDHNLVAVLFYPHSLGLPWDRALHGVLDAAPRALPILCHAFSEAIDWPQVAEAGAFYSLLLPFAMDEVRRTLGFVRDAKSRSAVIPIRVHSVDHEQAQEDSTRPAANGSFRRKYSASPDCQRRAKTTSS